MNKNKNTFSKFLTITSFNITILSINNNSLLANLNRNTFNYKEEENSFSYEPDEAFDDEIAKNSPIYTWRKEYFLFLDRKIEPWEIVVNAFILIIIFIMMLIYLEIIELNFCGLEKNLKKNIDLRAKLKEEIEIFDDNDTQKYSNDSNLIYDNLEISFQNNEN